MRTERTPIGIPHGGRNAPNGALPERPQELLLAGDFARDTISMLSRFEAGAERAWTTGREDLLGRVAVANLLAAGGNADAAANSAGILRSQFKGWVEKTGKMHGMPGLYETLTDEGVVGAINLPPRAEWPGDLTFQKWSSYTVTEKRDPASKPVRADTAASRTNGSKVVSIESLMPPSKAELRTRSASPVTARTPEIRVLPDAEPAANPAASTTATVFDPVKLLRKNIDQSYYDMKLFSDLEGAARGGIPTYAQSSDLSADKVQSAFFWQLFGNHAGDVGKLRASFPKDPDFVAAQLAVFGPQPDSFFPALFERAISTAAEFKRKVLCGYPETISVRDLRVRWEHVLACHSGPL